MERCSAPAGRLRLPWISSFDKTTKGVGAWRGRKKQREKGRLFRRPCWPAVQVYLAGRAPAGRIIQSNQAITPSIKSRIKGDATLDMTERMKPGTRTGSRGERGGKKKETLPSPRNVHVRAGQVVGGGADRRMSPCLPRLDTGHLDRITAAQQAAAKRSAARTSTPTAF